MTEPALDSGAQALRDRHEARASSVLHIAREHGVDSPQLYLALLCALEESRIDGCTWMTRCEERAVSLMVCPLEGDGLKVVPAIPGWQVECITPHERPGLVDGGLLLITWRRPPA